MQIPQAYLEDFLEWYVGIPSMLSRCPQQLILHVCTVLDKQRQQIL